MLIAEDKANSPCGAAMSIGILSVKSNMRSTFEIISSRLHQNSKTIIENMAPPHFDLKVTRERFIPSPAMKIQGLANELSRNRVPHLYLPRVIPSRRPRPMVHKIRPHTVFHAPHFPTWRKRSQILFLLRFEHRRVDPRRRLCAVIDVIHPSGGDIHTTFPSMRQPITDRTRLAVLNRIKPSRLPIDMVNIVHSSVRISGRLPSRWKRCFFGTGFRG